MQQKIGLHLLCREGIIDGEGACVISLFAEGNGARIGECEGAAK